ncbi:MAG TPA: hypothetical protein VEZ59_10785 [Sphingopyxis sp.]|jgi:hypothetical protein|nr:hypothetical protein [Sphingopyxis sp.]
MTAATTPASNLFHRLWAAVTEASAAAVAIHFAAPWAGKAATPARRTDSACTA